MKNKIRHDYDEALDFISYIEHRLELSSGKSNWPDFLDQSRNAVINVDDSKLFSLANSHAWDIEDWARLLIIGYCLCCIGFGDKGFSLLVQAYNLDKTSLTLERVYDLGTDLCKFEQLAAVANEDLSMKTPQMPRESRLIRAWIYKEKQNYADSENDYILLIRNYPDDIEVLLQYSGFLLAKGSYSDAVEIYNQIEAKDTGSQLEIYQGLAFCYIELGYRELARDTIEKGLILNCESTYLIELKQSLEKEP